MSTELCEPLREDEGLHSSIDASSTASSDFLQAIYCKHCDFWLNGPIKWRSHLRGYKHKKRINALHKTQHSRSTPAKRTTLQQLPTVFEETLEDTAEADDHDAPTMEASSSEPKPSQRIPELVEKAFALQSECSREDM